MDYSNKNIPIPPKNEYKLLLISKVEHVLKRMRYIYISNAERCIISCVERV